MTEIHQRFDIKKESSFQMCYFWKKLEQRENNGGKRVTLVAVINSVIIVWGLILTLEDIYVQQYPFSLYEIVYVLGYYVVHLLIIGGLLIGTVKENPIWYIPWILIMFIVSSKLSLLWIQSLFNGAVYYFTAHVVNVTILSMVWIGWWTVIRHFCYMWSRRSKVSGSQNGII